MLPDQLAYYQQRAQIERSYAAAATNPHAAKIHEKLACLYEKLIELETSEQPSLKTVASR